MGVGFTVVVEPARSKNLIEALNAIGERAFILGTVTDRPGVSFST
jgi:phosphoribosylaminoimidazole (AIR) synthetase